MTATESPADLMRRAADLVEQRAKNTTPGPWEIEYSYGGDTPQAVFVMDPDYPDDVDQSFSIGCFTNEPADNAWAALVHPGIAAALAVWLRDGAARCAQSQARWETGPQWLGVDDDNLPPKMTPERVRANVEHHWRHELAFARVLLGEDQS